MYHLPPDVLSDLRRKQNKKGLQIQAEKLFSIATYLLAAVLGDLCPIAAYIVVAVVSIWWIFPDKSKKKKEASSLESEEDQP